MRRPQTHANIDQWARIIAHFLKPGGTFFIAEIHPFCLIFDEMGQKELRVAHSYCASRSGLPNFNRADYTDRNYIPTNPRKKMLWPLSAIVQSLLSAGLVVASFQEYSYTTYQHFPMMIKAADGLWRLPDGVPQIPLLFSLKARKLE